MGLLGTHMPQYDNQRHDISSTAMSHSPTPNTSNIALSHQHIPLFVDLPCRQPTPPHPHHFASPPDPPLFLLPWYICAGDHDVFCEADKPAAMRLPCRRVEQLHYLHHAVLHCRGCHSHAETTSACVAHVGLHKA